MKNNETAQQEAERPEPFATLLDLLGEYDIEEILEDLSYAAKLASEDEGWCANCRAKAEWLHLEIDQLFRNLERFEGRCGPE